jgi:hypothetical protein
VKSVKVRVADLAPLSPYIIRVENEQPKPTKVAGAYKTHRVNFLANYLLLKKRLLESDGTLAFTEAEIAELTEEDQRVSDDVFTVHAHPFRLKAVVMFSLAAMLVVLPMRAFSTKEELLDAKAQIMNESRAGLAALKSAKVNIEEKNSDGAVVAFARAEAAFGRAESLSSMNDAVETIARALPEGRLAVSGSKSIAALSALSKGASDLSKAFADLKDQPTLTDKTDMMTAALEGLQSTLDAAATALDGVNASDLPAGLPIDALRGTLGALRSQLPALTDAMHLATHMLGSEAPQRYLVLFQNSNELRPTGGFLGSFALVDIKQGAVVNLEIPGDGSYNLQGRLTKFVNAPHALQILNPKWEFQDSNWFFDFPQSARKAAEFYAKSGGPSVDGVIAVNSRLMEKILAVTGPFEIPGTQETVDAKNFVTTAQRLAQYDYDKSENKPKAFIGKLAPKLLQSIASGDSTTLLALGDLFSNAMRSKDLQIWARNDEREATLRSFGWDGSQLQTDGDYVALVNTNIAGGKTDGVITEVVNDRTTVMPDGRVLKTVEITREHNGKKGDTFEGDTNLTYHRLYVPKGSKLISVVGSMTPDASEFGADTTLGTDSDITSDTSEYDVFDAWTKLKPGESATVKFSYELPQLPEGNLASLSTVYDLQSGTSRTIKHSISFPASWTMLWHDGTLAGDGTSLSFTQPFDHSFVSSVLFRR